MVLQPLTHARRGGPHLDPEIAQMRRRPDARSQQMGRPMNRPDDRMTSRPRNSVSRPPTRAFTPTQRGPSNNSSLTWVSVEIDKFSRIRVPGSR